jgi:hypothetical protein
LHYFMTVALYIWTKHLGWPARDLRRRWGERGAAFAGRRGAARAQAYTTAIDRWCR